MMTPEQQIAELKNRLDWISGLHRSQVNTIEQIAAERDADRAEIVQLCQERLQLTTELDRLRGLLSGSQQELRDAIAAQGKAEAERDGASMAARELRAERDEARAALDRVREPLRAALSEWEPEYDYYRDRAGRKGYSHDEVAAEVYGKAIEVATKALAVLDGSGT